MLRFRKFVVLAVLLAILLFSVSMAGTSALSDVTDHWAEGEIRQLVGMGAITGYPDGTYRPGNTITRAEFSSVLWGALGLKEAKGVSFPDIDGHWGQGRIEMLVREGIIDIEVYKQHYGPDEPITREEIAMMTVRLLGGGTGTTAIPFQDAGEVGPGFFGYVTEAYNQGIITGYPDNTFRPAGTATRAEAAVMAVRALGIAGVAEKASPYAKIQQAFLDGEIDRKTEVLLMLQAVYAPENLPEQYTGPKGTDKIITLKSELQWLINHQHELDPQTEAAVRPFILSPKDPGSYFHPAYAEDSNLLKNLGLVKTAHAAVNDWNKIGLNISAVSSDITLYYRVKGLPASKQLEIELQVLEIEEAIKKAWPMFKDLLNIQPALDLEIYLTNRLAADINGEAIYYSRNGNISRYEIRLNESLGDQELQATAVHELFHIFQYEMGLTWFDISPELEWLIEATAVWSEHHVYPSYNTEHEYLDEFFEHLNSDRLSTFNTREYASYMLFYFLGNYWGTPPDIVEILNAAVGESFTMDISGMFMREIGWENMKDFYGEFAFYNWNQEPYKLYVDTPFFPEKKPAGNSKEKYEVWFTEEREYSVFMDNGGIVYQRFEFIPPPEEMAWARFDFEVEIPERNNVQYVKRQALVKIGDTWTLEDWTDLKYREFCRRKDAENVDVVVLIHSNGFLQEGLFYEYTVDTKGDCPMEGYTKINFDASVSGGGLVFTDTLELYSADAFEYCPIAGAYVLTKRSATFSSLTVTEMPNPFHMPDVPEIGPPVLKQSVTRSGSISEEYDEEDQLVKFTLPEDGKVGFYEFPAAKSTGGINYTETGDMRSDQKKEDYPHGVSRGSVALEHGKKSYTLATGEKITQDCIIDETGISGTYTVEKLTEYGPGKYTVEFEYKITN